MNQDPHRESRREWLALLGFLLLSVVMLYPLSIHLNSMVPDPNDPLLNAWRMNWAKHSLLIGPDGVARLWDANIFYPYPLALAYSEHFLGETAVALPFLLLGSSPLLGMNLSVLLSFALTAFAGYLLISDWTGNRWAGLLSGLLLGFSPFRFGHIHHLELLVFQWMPLALLSLHWLLTRPRKRYLVLFVLFVNLQALSDMNYALHLALACSLLGLVYAVTGRVRWRWGLLVDFLVAGGVSLALNLPIYRIYLYFSDLMNALRTAGEVRVYSAAFSDYLTTIPHNLLYGWSFGHWQSAGHQFQPLMPVGVVGLLLILIGLVRLVARLLGKDRSSGQAAALADRASGSSTRDSAAVPLFLILLTLGAFILSLGTNDEAFGPALAPWLARLLPYGWLYEVVPGLKGIRVPARFGVLVVLGLSGLAGWGYAALHTRLSCLAQKIHRPGLVPAVPLGLALLILLECWSVPLAGPQFAYAGQIDPVYAWLRETPADSVVLELPQQDASEFAYEYYSTYHWRRLVNGGTGYTPPIHRQMRDWFKTFPDWRSVDVIQHMGVDYVLLHPDRMTGEEWQQILAQLPGYLAAFDSISQVGDTLVLHVAPPTCDIDLQDVAASVSLAPNAADQVVLTLSNTGPATFVADASTVSTVEVNGRRVERFIEPLLVVPGATVSDTLTLSTTGPVAPEQMRVSLVTLDRVLEPGQANGVSGAPPDAEFEAVRQPLEIRFQDGPRLAGLAVLPQTAQGCGRLQVALDWQEPGPAEDTVVLQLVDRYDRVVMESRTQPWQAATGRFDLHTLPLPGSLPAGGYGLRLLVGAAGDWNRDFLTEDGTPIPAGQLPLLPLVIHPSPLPDSGRAGLARFENGLQLVGYDPSATGLKRGDWLRFSLIWRAPQAPANDVTIFTQLLGPDGRVWGQHDNPPRGGWYPVSVWNPMQLVQDDYAFEIAPAAPPGEYRLIAGMYDSQTGDRLTVSPQQGESTDYVVLDVLQFD